MAKVRKLTPVELLERYPLNESRLTKIRANHAEGRHNWPRPFCPPCMGTPTAGQVSRTSLYPEREIAYCGRCHCWHWSPGRCFADDPAFLDLTLGPRSRMKSVAEVGVKPRTAEELAVVELERREAVP